MSEIKNDDIVTVNVNSLSTSCFVPIGPIYIGRGPAIRNIAMDVTELAGPPVRIKGEIVKPTSSLEEENARLRTELTHARNMNAVAMTDVATARRALELEIAQNNAVVAALRYTLKAMADELSAAAEKSGKDAVLVKAIEHADWTPPAGLPRGMR